MTRLRAPGVLLVLHLAACATGRPTPDARAPCPLPADAKGYPVTASGLDGGLSPEFLRRVARAVAGHWTTNDTDWGDSDRMPTALHLIEATLDVGESFSRQQWRPAEGDTTTLLLVYRAGRIPELRARAGRRPRFETRAHRAAKKAIERSAAGRIMRDTLPLVAPGTADSTVVVVAFGREPDAHSGVARFAVQERQVTALRSNRAPWYPPTTFPGPEGEVRLAFVVRPDSTPDLSTAAVLLSTADEFSAAVLKAFPAYPFVPAQVDCRVVPRLVVQPFVFSRPTPSPSP